MGETQKVERARFVRPSPISSGLPWPSERYQTRLLRVEFQSVFFEAAKDDSINSLRIFSMRESDYHVVCEPHRFDFARVEIGGQVKVGKAQPLPIEEPDFAPALVVEGAPGGIDDPRRIRKRFGPVIHQAV